ncbi:MAG: orotidine 5'-phosphate decarboxylase [Candidatus Levybacteria bacterium RIFCSPHIGHO2_12_FULL_38_12]|nr:MAG: orotidine 5'-phosphate decarboxylase [Candidatus Levybacteria bacterium RIFCSPHIGHO2_01_FULL_38_12]OGH22434.1 MAG: orotidine 5'-phosphate decarboxylase [Candidatus Levybacteria bacterium RIFCSPHIGHO2_02_FULL_37_18]OGH23399.1 MAG: orotidine 5'-phosphate decarboxylase [Candidatus Levybacteria bacterium RIFCSPHIGHO2_12_FULL_38_12]OGH34908.1 MAG: orotidine 5'-phosphate decarboxylase [Candidatus Levybacteria bacterium RIFCSPLOWO2_01_FULL_37_20]OGH43650.1 MAG: orotidine 5'-phosphate decarboxy
MNFQQKLQEIVKKNNSLLCVGLDPDLSKLPPHILKLDEPLFEFNKAIIDETKDLVCAFKANSAFYEAEGVRGIEQLKKTIQYVQKQYPEIPVILDAKRADIGNTSEQYAKYAFYFLGVDAITVNPYLGFDSIEPFLKRKDKGIIILCKTSNPGSSDFQDIHLGGVSGRIPREISSPEPLYMFVAKKNIEWNTIYGNCLMVVGATYPEELKKIRELTPDMTFLVPGIGSQGGNLEQTLKFGLTEEKSGLIINVGRAIIYASNGNDFSQKAKEEAIKLRDLINQFRN